MTIKKLDVAPPEKAVEMPAPTFWPMMLALGLMLLAAGVLFQPSYAILGGLIAALALGGWIRQLLPGAGMIHVPLEPPARRGTVVRPPAPMPAPAARQVYGRKVHPYSAGIRGGIAGGFVMAILAMLYGLVSERGIWFPINLLAAMVLRRYQHATITQLQAFSAAGLLMATAIHAVASVIVGLCLAVLFPTLPRWPVFWGGIVAPLVWTGIIYGLMSVLNPEMDRYVNWIWFALSQFGYGLVASLVIHRSELVWRPHERRP